MGAKQDAGGVKIIVRPTLLGAAPTAANAVVVPTVEVVPLVGGVKMIVSRPFVVVDSVLEVTVGAVDIEPLSADPPTDTLSELMLAGVMCEWSLCSHQSTEGLLHQRMLDERELRCTHGTVNDLG